jgi:uncharacterized membrane protein
MMKRFFTKEWLSLFFLIIPFVFIGVNWSYFPSYLPMHWSSMPLPDIHAPKEISLLFFPIFNIILFIFFLALPRLDGKRDDSRLFGKSYRILRVSVTAIIFILFIFEAYGGLGISIGFYNVFLYSVLIVATIIGNSIYTAQFVNKTGFRTPWSIKYENNWISTNRFAGILWVSLSLIILVIAIFTKSDLCNVYYFLYLICIFSAPFIYSFIQFKKEQTDSAAD